MKGYHAFLTLLCLFSVVSKVGSCTVSLGASVKRKDDFVNDFDVDASDYQPAKTQQQQQPPSLPIIPNDKPAESKMSWSAVRPVLSSLTGAGVSKQAAKVVLSMVAVASMQGTVAMLQYRTNPTGTLIAPPGRTFGTCVPRTHAQQVVAGGSADLDQGFQEVSPRESSWDLPDRYIPEGSKTVGESRRSKILHQVNRWFIFLVPYVTQRVGIMLQQYSHQFHFGIIVGLATLLDIPHRLFGRFRGSSSSNPHIQVASSSSTMAECTSPSKPLKRVLVIGDSLAVGLGTVDVFDAAKNNSVPFARIENMAAGKDTKDTPGPVFPRVLAETLATHFNQKVHWRSAGVDGGDILQIRKHCMGVVQEEVQGGRAPDLVVILCGVNDLKYFAGNPFSAPGPAAFRQRLSELVQDIVSIAPSTHVVLPMIPTKMFHANSPLNIFPLNFVLDAVLSFWESQKRRVAHHLRSNVSYIGLNRWDVPEWYRINSSSDKNNKNIQSPKDGVTPPSRRDGQLIAADGIHPNARCYALWAELLGNSLVGKKRC